MANEELARLFHELATLTELEDQSRQSFRARAYHNAVRAIEGQSRDLTELSEAELTEIKGIGRAIAAKIHEVGETGTMTKLAELRERFPPGYLEMVRIPGVGPKTVEQLHTVLGVNDIDDLKVALEAGKLEDVPGLGKKTADNIAKNIERLGLHGKDRRTPILDALRLAEEIVERLRSAPGARRVEHAGSLRRFRDTIADIDVVVAADAPGPVMDAFVAMPLVRETIAKGDKKSAIITHKGMQVDLRVVEPAQWGAALLYFTGSQAHNVHLRELAQQRGLTLNEYGLFEVVEDDNDEATTGERLASDTEEAIYAALDLQFIPPGIREDDGEIELAADHALPTFATVDDILGDLHVHTEASGDGHQSLEEVLDASVERGLRYLGISDHAEDLSINGLTRDEMLAQREQIAAIRDRYPDLTILHGAELNIGRDGDLDYDQDFLMGYDYCVASVHSHFRLRESEQTERVLRAIANPAVNVIGHLQGRRIGKRPPIDLDVPRILEAAAETGTAIEINCHLDRLDATVEVLRAARGSDVVFVIDTDSHRLHEFAYVRHGIRQAERGWVPADRIANTWEPERFLEWVAAKRRS